MMTYSDLIKLFLSRAESRAKYGIARGPVSEHDITAAHVMAEVISVVLHPRQGFDHSIDREIAPLVQARKPIREIAYAYAISQGIIKQVERGGMIAYAPMEKI